MNSNNMGYIISIVVVIITSISKDLYLWQKPIHMCVNNDNYINNSGILDSTNICYLSRWSSTVLPEDIFYHF